MTTINDIGDLVRVLREQPEWAEALRGVLLSRELLELPEEFAQFVKLTNANFQTVNARLERLETGVAEIRRDVVEIRRDVAPIKGAHARNGALRATRRMARTMGCRQVDVLDQDDLGDMADAGDTSGLEPTELRSFENADIVTRAADRETGQIRYLAIEASFTANPDDARRAVRNAEYLTRFTGYPATAMVASVRVNPQVQPDIDSGRVVWYEIESRLMDPE